jgi:hypothetical protein
VCSSIEPPGHAALTAAFAFGVVALVPDALHCFPLGPVAIAARAWRLRGQRFVTAVVKLSCTMRHEAPMFVAPPRPVVSGDRWVDGRPGASVARSSDLALFVRRPEIIVFGSAYAAPGQKLESTSVRMALVRDGAMLVNKRLDVLGDRRVREGEPEPAAAPFSRMPLVYERAFGGPGDLINPAGVGREVERDGGRTLPNILHPPASAGSAAPSGPAGFAAIPGHWPLRASLIAGLVQMDVDTAPHVELPDDFDESYFQAAPEDQRVDELRAGDTLMFVNLHPELATLRVTLPDARAVALAQTRAGARLPFDLRLDTLHVEPDAARAEIVFRGSIPLEEGDLEGLRIAAGIERPGRAPIQVPDLSTLTPPKPPEASVPLAQLSSTALLDREQHPLAAPAPALAVVTHAPKPNLGGTQIIELPREQASSAPPAAPPPPPAPQKRSLDATMIFEDSATEPAMPFGAAPPGPPPPAPPPPAPPPPVPASPAFTGTVTFDLDSVLGRAHGSTMELETNRVPTSLPFARASSPEARAPAVPVPGAPWSPERELAPVQDADEAPMTVALRESLPPEPPPLPPEPPLAPPPPPAPPPKAEPPVLEAEPEPKPKKAVWRDDPPAPAAPPPPAKPAPGTARQSTARPLQTLQALNRSVRSPPRPRGEPEPERRPLRLSRA